LRVVGKEFDTNFWHGNGLETNQLKIHKKKENYINIYERTATSSKTLSDKKRKKKREKKLSLKK
jgi:hypothetical protein